jgi:hypothetical protein
VVKLAGIGRRTRKPLPAPDQRHLRQRDRPTGELERLNPVSRHRDDDSHDPGKLGEPATEQYVGRRDLTHWSRPVRAFVGQAPGPSRISSTK